MKPQKWGIWEVHQPGSPDPLSYVPLPEYGPWDKEREARQMAELLTRIDPQGHALIVRECGRA